MYYLLLMACYLKELHGLVGGCPCDGVGDGGLACGFVFACVGGGAEWMGWLL